MSTTETFLAIFLGSKTSPRMAAWNSLPEGVRRATMQEGRSRLGNLPRRWPLGHHREKPKPKTSPAIPPVVVWEADNKPGVLQQQRMIVS